MGTLKSCCGTKAMLFLGDAAKAKKALMYHELSHAAHFNKVGAVWWNTLVYSEETTVVRYAGIYDPYGKGTDGTASQYISVAESWAEHMARTMCDIKYGANSKPVGSNDGTYNNGSVSFTNPSGTVTSLSSHLSYLESYDPNSTRNPFHWIPEGIYYDLIDTHNEPLSPITDGVSGYTNAQIFSALDADITSMPLFRDRLIGENPAGQTTQAKALFNQYHY